jgi:precorrin-2 dehydrogenase / sirohydrochlorin ferrochelatase
MRYFPVFLDLSGKRCLVVGAGGVGRRKLAALTACDPEEVLVLDVAGPPASIQDLLEQPGIRFESREFRPGDLEGRFLAFVATGDRNANQTVAALCREQGILCNVVDDPEVCDFISPSSFNKGELSLAVSTGGASPALARQVRREIEEFLGDRYDGLLKLLSRLRPLVLALELPQPANAALFKSLVESSLGEALVQGDMEQARVLLIRDLPPELQQYIPELLDGLA